MAKQWTIIAHPDYFISFRNVINNPVDRYKVTIGIREQLQNVDDLQKDLTSIPGETEQFEFDVMDYTIIVQWKEAFKSNIKLLEVYEKSHKD